jgi:hypothetical protein
MKTVLLLPLILALFPQTQNPVISHEGTPVVVISSRWLKNRQIIAQPPDGITPAPAMIAANKTYEKNRRENTSPAERDPNLDTIDGRSAALERAVQDSRAPKPVDGFAYRAKVHNASTKPIEIIFWEYQFKEGPDSTIVTRRQFLCGVSIKPEKDKELQAFSLSGPHTVVSVDALGGKSATRGEENVVINRVEFADGTIWQRKDWSFGEVRLSYARAVATPWGPEMCRGL